MYALNIDPANPKGNPTAAELRSLGVETVRFTFKDNSSGDQPDPQKVQFYQNLVQRLADAEINALIILSYESYPGKPAFIASDEEWDVYIDRLAHRAGQIAQLFIPWNPAFQIWNEPDLPPEPWYEPSLREAVFGRMMRRAYNTIKAVDANLRVVAGGLGSRDPDWLARVIQWQGGHLPADAIAIHPYGLQPEPEWPAPDFGHGYIGDLLDAYRQVTDLPLTITEIGVGLQDLDREGQGEYLRRFYTHVVAQYSDIVQEIHWFCYSDGMVYPHGLLNDAGDPNPTYHAYKEAAPPRPPLDDGIMEITAIVNRADYENMARNYWLKEDIDADIVVDGVLHKKGEIAFRGTTSLTFPKKGFKVKFSKKDLYQGRTKRFDLSASYPDKSLIRERMCFDLFNQSGVVSSKAWHVKFTIESKEGDVLEWGLFTGIEHIGKYFFRNRNRDEGGLYKADGGVVNGVLTGAFLDPQPEAVLKIVYDQKNAKPLVESGSLGDALRRIFDLAGGEDEDYSDLDGFIRQIDGWTPDDISQHLGAVMDEESYLDWLAVNTLVQSNDTYHKNYYLHNRMEDDKWEILPWDYDLTFGRNWNDYCDGLCDDLSEGTSIKGSAQMTNRLSQRILGNPVYYQRLRNKLLHLLETEFTEEKLFAKIDAYYAQITPLAHADTRKWPSNAEFDHERERLKDWVTRRRDFLYRELNTAPPPELLPDSIIIQLSFDKATLIEGDQVAFKATVRNVGSASTGDTVGVAFLIDDVYVTFGTVDAMGPGEEQVIQSVSTWQATLGQHRLKAVVDDVNRYPEASEENNMLEMAFEVQPRPGQSLSDVVVQDIAFERAEDGRIKLAALVANIGQAVTGDVVGVAFFVDDKYETFGLTDPINAGKARAVRGEKLLPLTGVRKITAIVDDINRFPEEREDNNTRTETIDFGAPPEQLADVIILDARMGQGRFTEGDPVIFEAVVKNIGDAVTGDVVGVAFLVDGQYITYGSATPMAPDEIRNIRAVSPWIATAGSHRLTAVADDINRFPEASEENNRFELDFQVFDQEETRLPDSAVEAIGYESDPDGQIILNATVANIGLVPTPEVVGVAFFVGDVYATYGITQPMSPGAREVIRAVQALSLSDTHKITAIVDDINRYDEISHQNNTLSRDINFSSAPPPGGQPERRAVWVTRYDWTIIGQTPAADDIDRIVANIARAGFNAIFFQVRGYGDAYYTPGLEPWASRLTGTAWETLGQDPGWDPLARLIEQAHAAGIEAHAYINAYPAWLPPPDDEHGELAPPAAQPPHFFDRFTYSPGYEEHPGEHALGYAWRCYSDASTPMPLEWSKYLYASPGLDLVRDHITAVAVDLVTRYEVDGVHLDHIRYAGPGYSYDPASNEAAGTDKTPQRDQWQRDRITDLVRRVSQQAKAIRTNALISAAVWPYYQDKWGWNLSEGYSDYYQDSKGWLAGGAIDAIAPMLYGGVSDDFERWQILMQDFIADQGSGHVYPGIGADYDDFNAIVQRIEAARAAGAPGHAIFSYGALERRGYLDALAAGPYAQPAELPAIID